MLLSKLAGNSEASGSRAVVLGQIWAGNDRASMDYIPKPYPGVVTDFRTTEAVWIYKRNDLKWEDLALGGQKLVQLQVYPAGMLLEPFVGEFGEGGENSHGCRDRGADWEAGHARCP